MNMVDVQPMAVVLPCPFDDYTLSRIEVLVNRPLTYDPLMTGSAVVSPNCGWYSALLRQMHMDFYIVALHEKGPIERLFLSLDGAEHDLCARPTASPIVERHFPKYAGSDKARFSIKTTLSVEKRLTAGKLVAEIDGMRFDIARVDFRPTA